MKFIFLSFTVIYFCASILAETQDKWVQNYFANLQQNYDKRVTPVGSDGPGTAVKVSCSMFILDINKVDDSEKQFQASFYFRQSWKDPRLQFSGKEELLLRDVNDIWSPDLFFVDEREGTLHQFIHPNIFVRIDRHGEVLYSVRVTLKFTCPMDLRNYPHDTQHCKITVESYAYRMNDIVLQWAAKFKDPVSKNEELSLFEFDVIDFKPSTSNISLSSGKYSRLDVHMKFKRNFGFYAIRLYVPFILLILMSFLSFWIRAEAKGIRMSLLLVILFLMVEISSEVNSSSPHAPYTKAIDVWIGFCESLVFGIFLEFIFVALSASQHEENDSKSKGEILLSMDPEAKEQANTFDSLKSQMNKLINMFDARNGGNGKKNNSVCCLDKASRIVFPVIFIIFNIIYWSMYCCGKTTK